MKYHGNVPFQPFDQEWLRVEPLKLNVNPASQFQMHLSRRGNSSPTQIGLIRFWRCFGLGQFLRFCLTTLAIVNKNDGGIRMAVDYREVNLQLETTANQLPYQPTLFQWLGGQTYFANVDYLWGYYQLKLAENSSNVTAIITQWGVYRFLACPFGTSTAPGEH